MQQSHNATVTFEATCGRVLLPRCEHCFDKHPLAYNPPVDSKHCLSCAMPIGEPVDKGDATAVITLGRTIRTLASRKFFDLARALRNFAKRI